jgi:polyisoprenyl-phosphate glycosyltransferase
LEKTVQLSIVIPCFNEEACLSELYARTVASARQVVGDDFELILVNDGSRDATWRIIKDLCQSDGNVVGVDLSRNHGHQLALTAGLHVALGERIMILDADLQDPPELLTPMMKVMDDEEADVVYGQRRSRAGETFFKTLSAKLFYRALNYLTDIEIPKDAGDFRLISRRALDALLSMNEEGRFIRGMVSWIGFRQVAFPYDRDSRYAGETKYPLSKMIKLTVDATTGFSTAPLRLASHLGVALAGFAVLLMIYVGLSLIHGHAVPGWASLMVVVVLLGSVQLIMMGVLGEYVGRHYIQSKRRPLFLVQDVVRARTSETSLIIGRPDGVIRVAAIASPRRAPKPRVGPRKAAE